MGHDTRRVHLLVGGAGGRSGSGDEDFGFDLGELSGVDGGAAVWSAAERAAKDESLNTPFEAFQRKRRMRFCKRKHLRQGKRWQRSG